MILLADNIGFLEIYLSTILIFAAIIDYQKQKIPNYLTFPTVFIALIYHFYLTGMDGLLFSILGTITGLALLIIPYIMGGMGAGDVKLLAALGAFVGAKSVFFIFLFTALIGGVYAILVLIRHEKSLILFFKKGFQTVLSIILTRKFKIEPENKNETKPRLCYGIAIALGGFSYMGLTICGYELV